ncbi:MAG: SDR family oxidoreductase [Phycisphaerales bacterium]
MNGRALVTGASRRVGRAVALALAARGWHLVLTTRGRAEDLAATAAEARRAGAPSVEMELLDAADAAALGAFCGRRADEAWDLLVHNASCYRSDEPVGRADPARDLRRAVEDFTVNAAAPWIMTRALAPALARSRRPGGGSVVALGDVHASGPAVRGFGAYLMSKAALHQAVRSLAAELAPAVRVNAVLPGVVAWPDGTPEPERERYLSRVPLGRSGTPEDAAGAVVWLGLEATYLTGVLLPVDGGRLLR